MPKNVIFPFLIILSHFAHTQSIDDYFENNRTVPFQKIYVTTDREFYFYHDTIWFSAFVVDGETHIPISESCNFYIDLIDESGKIIKNEMFPLDSGRCAGWLALTGNDIVNGKYLFRALTDYTKNFGNDAYFSKPLQISNNKSLNNKSTNKEISKKDNLTINFFPEGGFLLASKINKVAFKAINQKNRPINISGELIDEKGNSVTTFSSIYNGMGSFFFIPEKNKNYSVIIDQYPLLSVQLPEIKNNGAKLMMSKISNNTVLLNIVADKTKQKETFYIAVLHRGKQLFHLEISKYERLKGIRIPLLHFNEGINRLVLLNKFFQPISERLIFVDKEEVIKINIELNKKEFSTRERVEIFLESDKHFDENYLSMVVINENALPSKGISQNLKSYLLIDSELKGFVYSAADFFGDDDVSSEIKLDLLMLTQGWRNYTWNTLEKDLRNIKIKPKYGIDIAGYIKHKKKFLSNSEVTLSLSANEQNYLYETKTNLLGHFNFANISFFDSAVFILQCDGYKNGWNTDIFLDKTWFELPIVSAIEREKMNRFSEMPLLYYRLQYKNESNLRGFIPDPDSKVLEEINVIGKKPDNDDHFRMYSNPNYSFQIMEEDYVYSNIFQYLAARIPGVRVRGLNLSIRQAPHLVSAEYQGFSRGDEGDMHYNKDAPLYLIDGMIVDHKVVASLSVEDIDKVEMLTGAIAGIFGGMGEKGVISILTKRDFTHYFGPDKVPGTINCSIKGFEKYREFYSPIYTHKNRNSEIPDYRVTLYWNPEIRQKCGTAKVSFFTCDNISRYKVFVEGITQDGRICLGETDFEVNARK